MALTREQKLKSDGKGFELGFKHGLEDKAAGKKPAVLEYFDYSQAYILGYNKAFEIKYLIDAT